MIITGTYVTSTNIEMTSTGSDPSFYMKPPCITTVQRNVMIGPWGYAHEGRTWFNTTTSQWEMWAGDKVVEIG